MLNYALNPILCDSLFLKFISYSRFHNRVGQQVHFKISMLDMFCCWVVRHHKKRLCLPIKYEPYYIFGSDFIIIVQTRAKRRGPWWVGCENSKATTRNKSTRVSPQNCHCCDLSAGLEVFYSIYIRCIEQTHDLQQPTPVLTTNGHVKLFSCVQSHRAPPLWLSKRFKDEVCLNAIFWRLLSRMHCCLKDYFNQFKVTLNWIVKVF